MVGTCNPADSKEGPEAISRLVASGGEYAIPSCNAVRGPVAAWR